MHIVFQFHWQIIRFIIGLKVTLFVFKLIVGHQNCSMIAIELWFRVRNHFNPFIVRPFSRLPECANILWQRYDKIVGIFFFPTYMFYFQTFFFWTLYYHFLIHARIKKYTIAHSPKACNEVWQPFVPTWFDML